MYNSCRRSLYHLRRQLVLWDMFYIQLNLDIVFEGATININTRTLDQVLGPSYIFGILSTHKGSISFLPFPLFLLKGRNINHHSWTNFYLGEAFTGRHSSFRGDYLVSLPLPFYVGDFFLLVFLVLLILHFCIY